jgi:hypothetical protein
MAGYSYTKQGAMGVADINPVRRKQVQGKKKKKAAKKKTSKKRAY